MNFRYAHVGGLEPLPWTVLARIEDIERVGNRIV